MTGAVDQVVAGHQVDRHVHRRRETLVPALAQEVVVGGGQEPVGRQRPEQTAQRAGQQQRPGARRRALAGDVDEGELEAVPVHAPGGDEEVAGELVAVRRAQDHLRVPARRERRQLALGPQPVAQVDQHRLARGALDAEAGATVGDPDHEQRRRSEQIDHAAVQRGRAAVPSDRDIDKRHDDREIEQRQRADRQEEPAQDHDQDERRYRCALRELDRQGGEGSRHHREHEQRRTPAGATTRAEPLGPPHQTCGQAARHAGRGPTRSAARRASRRPVAHCHVRTLLGPAVRNCLAPTGRASHAVRHERSANRPAGRRAARGRPAPRPGSVRLPVDRGRPRARHRALRVGPHVRCAAAGGRRPAGGREPDLVRRGGAGRPHDVVLARRWPCPGGVDRSAARRSPVCPGSPSTRTTAGAACSPR